MIVIQRFSIAVLYKELGEGLIEVSDEMAYNEVVDEALGVDIL